MQVELSKDKFYVSESCNLKITIKTDEEIKKGDQIKIQLPNCWTILSGPRYTRNLQVRNPRKKHYINVYCKNIDVNFEIELHKNNFISPKSIARHGRLIVATLKDGKIPSGESVEIVYSNTFAPYVAGEESLWIKVKDKIVTPAPKVKVLGSKAKILRIIVPSGAKPGEKFEILIVSLDKYGNLSTSSFKNKKLLRDDGKIVTNKLNFSGKCRLETKITLEGFYRFKMGKEISNTIKINSNNEFPYWGDLHIHTKLSADAQGTEPYKYAREVSGLDFAAVTDHADSLGKKGFNIVKKWSKKFNKPGNFITFEAYEIGGFPKGYAYPGGHHNAYFIKEGNLYAEEIDSSNGRLGGLTDIAKVWPLLNSDDVLTIPHHTGVCSHEEVTEKDKGMAIDIEHGEPLNMRPVAEIYSHHGQSELFCSQHILSYEFNRMREVEHISNASVKGPFYLQDYWKKGHKLGVIASSDTHDSQPGKPHGGIAAVFSSKLNRESIFKAIKNKHCYATTGERILLEFFIDNNKMGETCQKTIGETVNIRLNVWGTADLLRVELLRYIFKKKSSFKPILSCAPRPESMEASYNIKDEIKGDCMYYVRVTQKPLDWPDMAWSSPIWIETNK